MTSPAPARARRRPIVSQKNKLALWTNASGRCEYEGCNIPLLGDLVSGAETLNRAYIAHIVAATPDGPRGDPIRSHALANALENLMLLCDAHHRLIDREDVAGHPEARLVTMKRAHEARIDMVTGIDAERGTHILHYAARIGEHDCLVSPDQTKAAVLPRRYPLEEPISLEICGTDYRDCERGYWDVQIETLRRQFDRKVGERLRSGLIRHMSVFAIGPQPLLIELGRLLSDIADVDVRQLAREPKGWAWRDDHPPIDLVERRCVSTKPGPVALKLAVSAAIDDARVEGVLGNDCAIWSLEAARPGNDVLGTPHCLAAFRERVRAILAAIKAVHGEDAEIHVFPALPVAMAVEAGRVWMPKADLPLLIYDELRGRGGFHLRHRLGAERETAILRQ